MPNHFDAARVAEEIVNDHTVMNDSGTYMVGSSYVRDALLKSVTLALLEARKAPEGHVIDDRGVVRKVAYSGTAGNWPDDKLMSLDVRGMTIMYIEAAEAAKEEA